MNVWMIRNKITDRYAKLQPGYSPVDWVDREIGHVFRRDPTPIIEANNLQESCEVLAFQLVPANLVFLSVQGETGVYVDGKLKQNLDGLDEWDMLHAIGVEFEERDGGGDDPDRGLHQLPETLKELEL
jgi:hypothetical protein